jgi:hypothetical protein
LQGNSCFFIQLRVGYPFSISAWGHVEPQAERRMGEMLRETEDKRAKGGGDQKSDHRLHTVIGDPDKPTLAELGENVSGVTFFLVICLQT